MWRSSRLSLVFWGVLLGFGMVPQVVSLLITIVASDLRRILATRTSPTGGARHVNTGDGGSTLSALLSISIMLFPLFLLPNLFIEGLAILGPRRIWMQRG